MNEYCQNVVESDLAACAHDGRANTHLMGTYHGGSFPRAVLKSQ